MAGVKGRSGRKANLEGKTIQEVCRLSAFNIIRALRSPLISQEFKAELGKHFVLRCMPTKIESDGSFSPKTIVMFRNEKALDDGSPRTSQAASLLAG